MGNANNMEEDLMNYTETFLLSTSAVILVCDFETKLRMSYTALFT